MLHGLPIPVPVPMGEEELLLSCSRRRDDNISFTDTDPSDRLREFVTGDIGGDSDGGVEDSDNEENNGYPGSVFGLSTRS